MLDIAIVGGGPAGISAWLSAHARGLDALLLTNPPQRSRLARAARIDNYPGFDGVTGAQLLERMYDSAAALGCRPAYGRVTAVMAAGGGYMLSAGERVYEASTLILAAGLAPQNLFPGEERLLGRGVSWCATCDGMLYRGRRVAVIGLAADAEEEAQFLRSIGCEAEYFDASRAKRYEIEGGDRVTALKADGASYPVDAVFVLRDAVRPDRLVPGLETDGGHIRTGARMETNLAGVFAAGDCTGAPYQIARAVGQGCTAALAAADYLAEKNKKE